MGRYLAAQWSIFVVLGFSFRTDIKNAAKKAQDIRFKSDIAPEVSKLQTMFEQVVHASDNSTRRLTAVAARVNYSYQCLPHNSGGRLHPRSVRHLVYQYFAKTHGRIIKGLEYHGMGRVSTRGLHEVGILHHHPSLRRALLDARPLEKGLSFDEVVAFIGALERLVIDESLPLLEVVYNLLNISATEPVDERTVRKIIESFLVVMNEGHLHDFSNATEHREMLHERKNDQDSTDWQELVQFAQTKVQQVLHADRDKSNPFRKRKFFFDTSWRVAENIVSSYGHWQNRDCREMKNELMELDPEGTGRVSLRAFYGKPDGGKYNFGESVEYLRKMGALDESFEAEAKVLIANYVEGPANCVSPLHHHSVCCISDCAVLISKLERQVLAPATSADQLLEIIANLSSVYVRAPRRVHSALVEKMRDIASMHGGRVPIHGRLFAQWLHFAYPHECPYPHESVTAGAHSPWTDPSFMATDEEIKAIVEKDERLHHRHTTFLMQWTDNEFLPLEDGVHYVPESMITKYGRIAGQVLTFLVLLVAVAQIILTIGRQAFRAYNKTQRTGRPQRKRNQEETVVKDARKVKPGQPQQKQRKSKDVTPAEARQSHHKVSKGKTSKEQPAAKAVVSVQRAAPSNNHQQAVPKCPVRDSGNAVPPQCDKQQVEPSAQVLDDLAPNLGVGPSTDVNPLSVEPCDSGHHHAMNESTCASESDEEDAGTTSRDDLCDESAHVEQWLAHGDQMQEEEEHSEAGKTEAETVGPEQVQAKSVDMEQVAKVSTEELEAVQAQATKVEKASEFQPEKHVAEKVEAGSDEAPKVDAGRILKKVSRIMPMPAPTSPPPPPPCSDHESVDARVPEPTAPANKPCTRLAQPPNSSPPPAPPPPPKQGQKQATPLASKKLPHMPPPPPPPPVITSDKKSKDAVVMQPPPPPPVLTKEKADELRERAMQRNAEARALGPPPQAPPPAPSKRTSVGGPQEMQAMQPPPGLGYPGLSVREQPKVSNTRWEDDLSREAPDEMMLPLPSLTSKSKFH